MKTDCWFIRVFQEAPDLILSYRKPLQPIYAIAAAQNLVISLSMLSIA